MRITHRLIGPPEAQEMLSNIHPKQRAIDPRKVAKYADAMKSGAWTGKSTKGICINSRGQLRDGQHRLNAVIKSKTKQIFTVETVC
jgi:hypothetical protein